MRVVLGVQVFQREMQKMRAQIEFLTTDRAQLEAKLRGRESADRAECDSGDDDDEHELVPPEDYDDDTEPEAEVAAAAIGRPSTASAAVTDVNPAAMHHNASKKIRNSKPKIEVGDVPVDVRHPDDLYEDEFYTEM